jgi:hypothetical protein
MSKDIEGAMFKSLSLRRTASISPDIANNNYNVSPEEFIKNSPKLDYIMRCVEAMKNKDAKTSQLMYMPIGVKYLDKIKQYLVNKGVYKDNEIAIISADSALSNPEKEEARISKITDSFNDREGDIKLVIGTQKIQVGMNLNKNTSTLYMPYVEWNPTDYVQTVGRMWRQGNSYKNVRVVVPLLKNSSDSFMFQKLDEKIKRLNDLMGSDKEYIENADLETEEEKIAMISNPVKRAKMYTLLKKDNINFEIKKLEARENAVRDYKEKLKRYEDNIKYFQKKIDELMQTKKEKGELPVWQEERLKDQKKSLAANKKALENVKAQIEYNGYDFEGKDSAESVEAQKNKFEEELTKLEELERQKIEEYSVDYENERRNPKSIDELIKDFSDETEKLYSDDKANDIDIPDFMQKENEKSGIEDFDLSPVYEKVQKGAKVNELVKHLPKEVGEMLSDIAGDYKIVEMKTTNNRNKGSHSGKAKVIELNLKAIGNNPYKFVRTLAHEVEHARQTKVCQSILSKPRHTWTGEERTIIAHYNICQRANRDNQRFYKAHKNIIDEFYKQEFTSEKEMIQAVSNVEPKKRAIINRHIAIYETYRNAQFEVQARIQGEKYAERYTTRSSYGQGIPSSLSANSRGFKKWSLGTNSQNRSSQREYSIEPEYEENNEIREKGLDKVYKWHGDIGKDRFDVDKKLNSFIQTTKGTAKEFSRKLGIKVSDKMVREIMPFLRERTNLPEKLNRPDLKKFFDKLSGADKARLTDLADSVSSYFDKYYKNYEATNGVADAEGIENHISHIWDLDKKQKSLMTNYFTTSSKFAKTRTIDTLVRGIDGFEINGEMIYFKPKTLDYAEILKTSSDNLIKATHDRILAEELKNLKYDGKPLIMARSKAPSDWVEVTHPALNKAVYAGTTKNDDLILRKESVKVHPAIAPQVSAIFEVQKSDNKFWKAYDTVNGMLKQTTLGFSGFHGYALTESAVGNMGLKNTISELNPKKIYDSIKNGNYEVFKNEKIVKQAMEDGLQIGTPQSDMNRNQVEEFLGKIPHLGRLLRGAAEINNKILWDHLHTMYKIRSYEHILNKMGGVENTTKAQRREIAQWVNDSLGGQAWELLGFKKSSIKAAGRGLLSPDWNISAARQFFGLFDGKYLKDIFSGKDTEFWKFTKRVAEGLGVKGSDSASGTRGRIGRPTFLRAAIYSLILCNLINAYFREKDRKENPDLYPKVMRPIDYTIWANSTPTDSLSNKALPYAFLGRNKDNSARYLRLMKQFREVPEMVSSPIDKFGGKSASILNAISQTALGISPADIAKMLTGKSEDVYYNQEIWQGYGKYAQRKEGMDLVTGMGKTAAKSAMPFVISKSLDEKHDASAWDMFAQTSRGLTYGKTMRAYNKAYRENKKEDVFQKIGNRAYQDGMTTEEIDNAKKDALTKYRTDNSLRFKHSYVEAMENNDRAKIQQITDKMRKRHLPVDEQKRIYEVAYKEYMKKK